MVSHFHYDPVWWGTQGQFTESRLLLPGEHGELPEVRTAFELVALHLEAARQDPDYKFVLAEIDYLKPHFDAHPEDRADLRRFIADGRIEIVGGSYNEPNTNLTCAESTIRNAIYGIGYQRDVLGADPRSAWMLDAFGHDPGYPGLMAAAGLTSSAWARGPFHQWGPHGTVGSNERMQFGTEFEWISPDGNGLLTSYMANHYGAGWVTHRAPDLPSAEQAAYDQFRLLAPVATTRNVMLPVGADHVIPCRWATGIHRDWNARYRLAAVRHRAAQRVLRRGPRGGGSGGRVDNPPDQGHEPALPGQGRVLHRHQAGAAGRRGRRDRRRAAGHAGLAGLGRPRVGRPRLPVPRRVTGQGVAAAGLRRPPRRHHRHRVRPGLPGPARRLAGGLAARGRRPAGRGRLPGRPGRHRGGGLRAAGAAAATAGGKAPDGAVVVFNTLARARSALARVTLSAAGRDIPSLADESGRPVPCLPGPAIRDGDGSITELTLTFQATDVPALGYRTYQIVPGPAGPGDPGWRPADGTAIENESFLVIADPARGGALATIADKRSGTELLRAGAVGNELLLQEEYASHPRWGEGPWLISTKGPGRGSSGVPARVRAERCAIGSRLIAEFSVADLRITQETVLWDGASRIEFRTHVDGSIGQDRLLRVRFPADVPGGLPVYQTASRGDRPAARRHRHRRRQPLVHPG